MRTLNATLQAALAANSGSAVIKATVKQLVGAGVVTQTPQVLAYELDGLTAKLTIPHGDATIDIAPSPTETPHSSIFRIERGMLIDGVEYVVNSSYFAVYKVVENYQKDVIYGHIFQPKKYEAEGDLPAEDVLTALVNGSYVSGTGYVNTLEFQDYGDLSAFSNAANNVSFWWQKTQFLADDKFLRLADIRDVQALLRQKYVAELADMGENVLSPIDNQTGNWMDQIQSAETFLTTMAKTRREKGLSQNRFYFFTDEIGVTHNNAADEAQPHNLGFRKAVVPDFPSGNTVIEPSPQTREFVTVAPPDLRAQPGDYFTWQDENDVTRTAYCQIKEVFDPEKSPSWYMELSTINLLGHTEGG